ncbi:hypothetical protein L1049_007726 [Liquidambar formosana]|uniref:Apple domain-containing protein n=1 Tax=Liquidambar formosana TaxID=63359 RepID=A0AAP0X8M7_LIQFO
MGSTNKDSTAYHNSEISGDGSGCFIWFGDLIDIQDFIVEDSEQDIYIRMPISELELLGNYRKRKKRIAIVVAVSTVSEILVMGLVCRCRTWKKIKKKGTYGKYV